MKQFVHALTLAVISTILTTNSFSQSIQELDRRNGFKQFKIGDSKSKFSKYLKNSSVPNDDYVTYRYLSDSLDDYSVFGYKFDGIMLKFDKKDKLASLIVLKEYGAND